MSIPITGVYVNYLNSFFGNLDSQDQQELWEQFAQANGYSVSNPPPSTLVAQEQFIQFAKGIFEIQQTLILSPDEVKKRDIMFKTFDILLEMLTTLQNTVGVQGKSLIFYGKWQEQYTHMLTRVPTYVGDTNSSQVHPLTLTADTLDQLKFGYNNISAKDIAEWWAYNQAQIPLPAVLGTDSKVFNIDSEMLATPITLPAYTLSVAVNPPLGDAQISFIVRSGAGTIPVIFPDITTSTSPDAMTRYQENLTNFNAAFADAWNTIQPTYQNVVLNSPQLVNVPWQHTYVTPAGSTDTTEQSRGDAASKARGEINARNQQYIENIRSLRDVVQNTAKQLESNLSQTKEAITQQSNLLTSILDSLKGMIAAIFR